MPQDWFDANVAATYDAHVAEMFDPSAVTPAVDLLAELAGDGAALEFGIGTGRIALPLRARGVPVHGIDLSTAMLDELRRKPGADQIPATVGDFATVRVDGRFRVVYLVFNTINNLTTQDEQVACFANAARHLEPGGHFVIEVGVPQLQRLAPGETLLPFSATPEHLGIDDYDVVDQALVSHHYYYRSSDGRMEQHSIPFRYVWPAELDLMARLAGMHLVHRWAGFDREPFSATSPSHVSVWQLPA